MCSFAVFSSIMFLFYTMITRVCVLSLILTMRNSTTGQVLLKLLLNTSDFKLNLSSRLGLISCGWRTENFEHVNICAGLWENFDLFVVLVGNSLCVKHNLISIHPRVAEMFQSEPKWWTGCRPSSLIPAVKGSWNGDRSGRTNNGCLQAQTSHSTFTTTWLTLITSPFTVSQGEELRVRGGFM